MFQGKFKLIIFHLLIKNVCEVSIEVYFGRLIPHFVVSNVTIIHMREKTNYLYTPFANR